MCITRIRESYKIILLENGDLKFDFNTINEIWLLQNEPYSVSLSNSYVARSKIATCFCFIVLIINRFCRYVSLCHPFLSIIHELYICPLYIDYQSDTYYLCRIWMPSSY
jgi:hypothetical protein